MTDFQKLLNKIKEFKEGADYTLIEISDRENKREYQKEEIYLLSSSQLKKEIWKIVLNTEAGAIYSCFTIDGEKNYEYKRGDREQDPDQFSVKTFSPAGLEKRKKETEEFKKKVEENKKDIERRKEEFEKKRKEWKIKELNEKKCAFCHKEIKEQQGIRSIGPTKKKENRLYFCFVDKCLEKYLEQKNQKKENYKENDPLNCVKCGSYFSGEGCWEYFEVNGKIYCGDCSKKLTKKTELEQEQEKLSVLKEKYNHASNSIEKENLQKEIDKTENHIRDLQADKNKNSSNQSPNPKNWGKYCLIGGIVLAVILISVGIIRKKRKKGRVN